MKYLLATLSGMAVTLCVFVGGVAFALVYLTAEPVPVQTPAVASTPAFTTKVVKVKPAQQDFERGESQPAPKPSPQDEAIEPALHIDATEPPPEIDDITTASIAEPEVPEPAISSDDHLSWCSSRYRSYRPEDNSYTPYSGGRRECISPFSGNTANASSDATYLEASAAEPVIEENDVWNGYLSPQHVESCYSRYRSYRPEDNTYQPYGGGPRQQCQ